MLLRQITSEDLYTRGIRLKYLYVSNNKFRQDFVLRFSKCMKFRIISMFKPARYKHSSVQLIAGLNLFHNCSNVTFPELNQH